MATAPVLCILGAGSNVGAYVGKKFASQGYQVALVSRLKRRQASTDGVLHVPADFADSSSIARAFAEVRQLLGIPSVVIYNAAAHTPGDKANPAALPWPALSRDLAVNTISVLAAANEAVKGFRELPFGSSKTFIYTGNRLNVEPIPGLLNLGVGKAATAHLIASCAVAYKGEHIKFYYADQRTPDGLPVYNAIDGEAHASMYWQLAEEQVYPWLATFVKGVGYTDFSQR